MTLIKAQIRQSIQNKSGFTKKKSSEIMETLLETIKSTLTSGEDVLISGGFGKLCVNHQNERRGRNPSTGEDMMIEARKIVKTHKWGIKLILRQMVWALSIIFIVLIIF